MLVVVLFGISISLDIGSVLVEIVSVEVAVISLGSVAEVVVDSVVVLVSIVAGDEVLTLLTIGSTVA